MVLPDSDFIKIFKKSKSSGNENKNCLVKIANNMFTIIYTYKVTFRSQYEKTDFELE